jgi:hypothetical protein
VVLPLQIPNAAFSLNTNLKNKIIDDKPEEEVGAAHE